jgi:hypothetical protein
LAKQQRLPFPFLSALILLFMPYIYFHSFTVYTSNFGLLFGVAALYFYLRDPMNAIDALAASVLATLAIYCRQYYLVLPFGMLLYELLSTEWRRRGLSTVARQDLWRWLVLATPGIAFLPLVLLWGGLTTPQHHSVNPVHPVMQHFNFLPIFVGFYFLPAIVNTQTVALLRDRRLALLTLAVLFPVFLAFPIVYSQEGNAIAGAIGIIAHGTEIVGGFLVQPVSFVARSGLWAAGVVIILGVLSSTQRTPADEKLLALLAAFLLLMSLTPFVSERYYIMTVPWLVLLLHRHFRTSGPLVWWLGIQIALSLVFSYWQIEVKTFW